MDAGITAKEPPVDVEVIVSALRIKDVPEFSERSISSLVEIVNLLATDEGRTKTLNMMHEAAVALRFVFENIAWVDGQLDRHEMEMLDNYLRQEASLADAFRQVIEDPEFGVPEGIPMILREAVQYDKRLKTSISHVLVNTLEMVAYGFAMKDGETETQNFDSFRSVIKSLRDFVFASA